MSLKLLTPTQLGAINVPNRVFLAPLTRVRCSPENVPGALVAEYYRQRASAGLLIAEATMVAADALAWPHQPGLVNDAQVAGWRKVTDAVHAQGGRIYVQIWHPGRATHQDLNAGVQPVSSSTKPIQDSMIHTPKGKQPYPAPRALETREIPGIVDAFRQAAVRAKQAGFDGVQIHGAHGYLVDQFLRDGVNDRTDRYGGSIENRARLLFEVVDAAAESMGISRVGVRISPLVSFNDLRDSNPNGLVAHVAQEAQRRGLGFLELRHVDPVAEEEVVLARIAREHFKGALVRNGSFTLETGEAALQQGLADAIAYGRPFIANPDLPRRFLLGSDLNPQRPETFYTHEAEGYTDYPALA